MWELDLIVKYKYRKYLFYIKNNILSSNHYNNKGIFATIKTNNLCIMSIAIIDINKELIESIKTWIAESIIFIEKESYIAKKDFLNSSNFKQAFVKAIALINVTEDIEIARKKIDMHAKSINLHSLFNFRLRELTKKWDKEFLYIISNNNDFSDDKLLDILKTIISSNTISKSLSVDYVAGNFILTFDNKNIIAKDEADLVANLIILSPNKLNINCKNNITSDTLMLLKYLFENKLDF